MIKADEKVTYDLDGNKTTEKFTHFEELQKRVEVLQETVDEITAILRSNNLIRKEEIEAPYFDEDEVYKRLEKK